MPKLDNVTVARASLTHLGQVVELLEEAAAWTSDMGLQSWSPGSFRDPEGRGGKEIRRSIEEENVYICFVENLPVGTVTLQPNDPVFWPNASDDALYVHKLAVKRSAAGMGLGAAIITWADLQAHHRGKHFLRLDTLSSNAPLRRYYEQLGFVHRRDITTWFDASLYERRVAGNS